MDKNRELKSRARERAALATTILFVLAPRRESATVIASEEGCTNVIAMLPTTSSITVELCYSSNTVGDVSVTQP